MTIQFFEEPPFRDWKHGLLMRMGNIYLKSEESLYRTVSSIDVQALLALRNLGYVYVYKMDYGCIGAELSTKGLEYVKSYRL